MFIFVIFRFTKREVFFVTLSNANHGVTMVVLLTLKSTQCKYFDEEADVWKTRGCSVANSTINTTICRCDRIAQFGVSKMPISTDLSFQNLPVRCGLFNFDLLFLALLVNTHVFLNSFSVYRCINRHS